MIIYLVTYNVFSYYDISHYNLKAFHTESDAQNFINKVKVLSESLQVEIRPYYREFIESFGASLKEKEKIYNDVRSKQEKLVKEYNPYYTFTNFDYGTYRIHEIELL